MDEPHDLLITGADVLTDPWTLVESARVLVRQGKIVSVTTADESAEPPTANDHADDGIRRISLPGRLIIPGLVNLHTHAALCMLRGVAEDLGFAPAYTPGMPGGGDLTPGEACALARLGALEALRFGSTTMVDTYVHASATLPAMGELGLRVCASPRIHDTDLARLRDGQWHVDPAIGEAMLEEAVTLAERWPRTEHARLSAHFAAHAADTCSASLLGRIAGQAQRFGLPVAIHLAQSRIEVETVRAREGIAPLDLLERCGLLGPQLIAAHCIHLDVDEIARLGASGAHVAHIPKGNAAGGSLAPTVALARAGAVIGLGTDNMHADMVETLRWALAVARLQDGRITDDWQPAQVLAMATLNGATALGLSGSIGRLAPGHAADMVVIDTRQAHFQPLLRPLGALVHVGQGRDVEHVFVAGEQVIRDGAPTRVDMRAVIEDAERAACSVWQRAGGLPPRGQARVPGAPRGSG